MKHGTPSAGGQALSRFSRIMRSDGGIVARPAPRCRLRQLQPPREITDSPMGHLYVEHSATCRARSATMRALGPHGDFAAAGMDIHDAGQRDEPV